MSLLKLGSGGSGGTWGGGLIGSRILGPDGATGAPTFSFVNASDTGIWYQVGAGNDGIVFSVNGIATATFSDQNDLRFGSNKRISFTSGVATASTGDLFVSRYAAKQLMISGDGTGATTNAGWILGYFGSSGVSGMWSSTVVPSSSNHAFATTGAFTEINGTSRVDLLAGNVLKVRMNNTAGEGPSITAGTATTDVNALNITQTWNEGSTNFTAIKADITNTASGATAALMDLKVGGTSQFIVYKGGDVTLTSGASIQFPTRTIISAGSLVGGLLLQDINQTSFNRVMFGGTTSSFPALKRSTTSLEVKLADDSAYTTLNTLAHVLGGAAAAATTSHRLIKKTTGIADNTATAVATVTVPNANHAAAIKVTILSSNGSTDAFESSRVATGTVVVARTTGANAVAAVSTLEGAQIATVSGGATHTLAYGVSAISGAVGDPNTFDITVTIDDSGNLGSNQAVCVFELVNAEATGITIA